MGDSLSFWRLALRRNAPVSRFSVGSADAVFCSRTQQLSALNPTASRIWSALERTASCEAAVDDIVEVGASESDARAFVTAAVSEWLSKGYFRPDDLGDSPCIGAKIYAVGSLVIELRCYGAAAAMSGEEVLGAFPMTDAATRATLEVRGVGDFDFLFFDTAYVGMSPRQDTPAAVKALVTEMLGARCEQDFLMHGAMLSRGGRTLVLAGAPGAGKTTLTLALAASGFSYHGDDIVQVSAAGRSLGAPFAAAVKEGAWPLLRPYISGLYERPVRTRSDGKRVRYVMPASVSTEERTIDHVLMLSRQAGAAPRFEQCEPLEALCFLLDSSFSGRNRIEATTLEAFAGTIGAARCGRFIYSDLESAIAAVKDIIDA